MERIAVTNHALKRARERHPELGNLTELTLLRVIRSEVGAAVRAGRKAKTAPREVCGVDELHTKRSKGQRSARFVWTPTVDRAYLYRQDQGTLVVITCYATIHTVP